MFTQQKRNLIFRRLKNHCSNSMNLSSGNKRFSCGYSMAGVLLFCLLTLNPSFAAGAAASNGPSSRQQIYARAVAQAESDIAQAAKRSSWPTYSVKVNVFIPNEVTGYKRCTTPLSIALPAGDRMNLSRLRYDLRCASEDWETNVTIKPDIYLPVLVTKHSVERGVKLTANDLELKRHNISNLRNGFIIDPDHAVGLTVKRRIRPLQPLTLSQLEQPILVKRGQQVIMIASQEGIEIRTLGEAMKNGRKGDLIQVRNLDSKKSVSAVVDDLGVVKIPFALGH